LLSYNLAITFGAFIVFLIATVIKSKLITYYFSSFDVLVIALTVLLGVSVLYSSRMDVAIILYGQFVIYSAVPYALIRCLWFVSRETIINLATFTSILLPLLVGIIYFMFGTSGLYQGERLGDAEILNPIGLAMIFGSVLLFIAIRWHSEVGSYSYNALGICVALGLLFATGSRGPLFVFGLLFLVMLYLFKKRVFIIGAICIALVFAFVLDVDLMTDQFFERFKNPIESLSVIARFDIWALAIEEIKASPIIGMGLYTFEDVYGLYAHNFVLDLGVTLGVLGVLLAIGFLFFTGQQVLWVFLHRRRDPIMIGLASLCLGYLVVRISSVSLVDMKFYFIFTALMINLKNSQIKTASVRYSKGY
jgi:O-antigen ligase